MHLDEERGREKRRRKKRGERKEWIKKDKKQQKIITVLISLTRNVAKNREYNLKIFNGVIVFRKDEPENFKGKHVNSKKVRINDDQFSSFIRELQGIKSAINALISRLERAKNNNSISQRIETLLAKGEVNFTELLQELRTTKPTLSKHLSILISQHKIERVPSGKHIYYRLSKA